MKSELLNVYFSFTAAGVINVAAKDLNKGKDLAKQRIKSLILNAYGDRCHLVNLECTAYYNDEKQVEKWMKINKEIESA